MNGVEILSQTNIYETEAYGWLPIVFAGIALLIGLIISIVEWVEYGFDANYILVIFGLLSVGFFVGVLGYVMTEHKTDTINHIEYKVTIDDSVSMNEFLDKYEILDQEGKIYTVKERE